MNEQGTTEASPSLPTSREPENKSPKGSPGRLHLLAATVLRSFEQNPDPWYPEFREWREALLGECPRAEGGKRGYENWNLVSLGMLLAWGYFAGQLGEAAEEVMAQPPQQLELPLEKPAPELRPTFAILGADGQPLVEGYK